MMYENQVTFVSKNVSDGKVSAKIKLRRSVKKIMHLIIDNVVQSCLSRNYLTQNLSRTELFVTSEYQQFTVLCIICFYNTGGVLCLMYNLYISDCYNRDGGHY